MGRANVTKLQLQFSSKVISTRTNSEYHRWTPIYVGSDCVGTIDLDLMLSCAFRQSRASESQNNENEECSRPGPCFLGCQDCCPLSGAQMNCCIRNATKMWTRQLESLPGTLKNVYRASGQQSHCGQRNQRLNHHEQFGPCRQNGTVGW